MRASNASPTTMIKSSPQPPRFAEQIVHWCPEQRQTIRDADSPTTTNYFCLNEPRQLCRFPKSAQRHAADPGLSKDEPAQDQPRLPAGTGEPRSTANP